MACVPLPEPPPAPTLPSPFSVEPQAPPEIDFDPALCCKIPPFLPPIPPIPLPPLTVNPATAALVANAMSTLDSYFDQLVVSCPRE